VPTAGSYKVKINYKMRYKDKDFILANTSDELAFNLTGKGKKVRKLQDFDGNEQVVKTGENLGGFSQNNISESSSSQSSFSQSNVGQLQFDQAGIQQVTLKQGQAFELKASTKDFKAQDQRYRAMNIEIDSIELVMPNT